MVDAEQTYFQPAIHRITMEMMKKFNTEKAIVFNTYQNYLKICYHSLVLDLEQAARQNFYFGAKLVRGAYMEQVRTVSSSFVNHVKLNPLITGTRASQRPRLRGPDQPYVRGHLRHVPPLPPRVHAEDERAEAEGGRQRAAHRHHGRQSQRGHGQIRHTEVRKNKIVVR